jgi:hypothetical protein
MVSPAAACWLAARRQIRSLEGGPFNLTGCFGSDWIGTRGVSWGYFILEIVFGTPIPAMTRYITDFAETHLKGL